MTDAPSLDYRLNQKLTMTFLFHPTAAKNCTIQFIKPYIIVYNIKIISN